MGKRMKSEVYSIFGQIETIVGEAMVKEGKATKIDVEHIPPSVIFDARGRLASFALVMNRQQAAEFDRRVAQLRA